jgi:alpha/beta superfamily hydrolase
MREKRLQLETHQATTSAATIVAADGSRERAEFRGEPGSRVFTYVHLPSHAPRAAAVICSPLHGEFAKNYRREVMLARAFAKEGIAALRFHYRCTGNSDGDGEDLSFDSMREDALAGVEQLQVEAPGVPLFVVGTRWSALVAASTAERHPEARVVLWEPLLESARFFKDAFRSRLVREVRRGVHDPASGRDLEDRLRSGEAVDVVAHRIEPRLYASSVDRSLEAELGETPRRVLAIQIGPTGSVRPDLVRLVDRWREAGLRVDVEGIRGDETWWFVDEQYVDETVRTVTGELIEKTVTWISANAQTEAGT